MSADHDSGPRSAALVSLGTNDIAKAIALLTAMAAESRPDDDRAEHLRQTIQEKDDPWQRRRVALKKRTGPCRIILESLVLVASALRLITSALLEVLVLAASILRLVTSMILEGLVLIASLLRIVSAILSSGLIYSSDLVVLFFDGVSMLSLNAKRLLNHIMNCGAEILLGSIPFHLKSTSHLHAICVCSTSFAPTSLGYMVSSYLESRRFTQPQQQNHENIVGMSPALEIRCCSLAQWPLCPGKMSYCVTSKQVGSWGNQSELHDIWSSLPALTMPGASTTFWCVQIPLPHDVGTQLSIVDYLTKQFKSCIYPLLSTQRAARWIQAQSCSKLVASPKVIVLLDITTRSILQPELVSEIFNTLNDVLKEKLTYSCELRLVTAARGCELDDHLNQIFASASHHEEPLSVSVVEAFLNDLTQVVSFEQFKKEILFVNSFSIRGPLLKRLAEVRGIPPPSDLPSLIDAVSGGHSHIKALHSSFQEEDAVSMVEESIQSASEIYQADYPQFVPSELDLHLQAVARSIQLQLSEQGIHSEKLDFAAKAEIEGHVSNAVTHNAQMEHDRKYYDIQSAIKSLIDALEVSHTQVLKCL